MKKNKTNKWQLIICCLVAAIFIATIFVLFCVKILPLVAFLVLLLVILLLLSGYVVGVKIAQVRAKKIAAKKEQEIKDYREKKMKELYELLGVELVYNEDGTIKDIFELIGIPKRFDKDGKRIKTIYEELKINPRITPDGVELPNVFIIKNRVKKVARGIAEPLVLTAKPIEKKEGASGEESKSAEGKDAKSAGGKDAKSAGGKDAKEAKPAGKPASKGAKKKVGGTTFITPAKSGKKAKTDKLSAPKVEIKKLEAKGKSSAFKAEPKKTITPSKSEKPSPEPVVVIIETETKKPSAQVTAGDKTKNNAGAEQSATGGGAKTGENERGGTGSAGVKPVRSISIKAHFYGAMFIRKEAFMQKHMSYFENKDKLNETEIEPDK